MCITWNNEYENGQPTKDTEQSELHLVRVQE